MALMALSTFLAVEGPLLELREHIMAREANLQEGSPGLSEAATSVNKIARKLSRFGIQPRSIWDIDSPNLLNLRFIVEEYLCNTLSRISWRYFSQAARFESEPYRFTETCLALRRGPHMLPPEQPHTLPITLQLHVHAALLADMEGRNNTAAIIKTEEIDAHLSLLFNTALKSLLSVWQAADVECIPRAVIVFLNGTESDWTLKRAFLKDTETHLWKSFPRTLVAGTLEPATFPFAFPSTFPPPSLKEVFTALWRLAYIGVDIRFKAYIQPSHLYSLESVLKTISNAAALLKIQLLRRLRDSETGAEFGGDRHTLPMGPTNSSVENPYGMVENDEPAALVVRILQTKRIFEASVDLVAEYLEHCATDELPYNALETWEKVTYYLPPQGPVHSTYQLRLATSVKTIFAAGRFNDLLNRIVNCSCWVIYAEGHKTEEGPGTDREGLDTLRRPWLDDPVARQTIRESFTGHAAKLSLAGDSPHSLARLRDILRGIDTLHREVDSRPEDGRQQMRKDGGST
ncbi:hypothetical protein DFH06DRAFT_1131502 [Mycena polygramma]|nr:hypothetical protein DFH06DRAFT_1131502 [Mycena polygramma]